MGFNAGVRINDDVSVHEFFELLETETGDVVTIVIGDSEQIMGFRVPDLLAHHIGRNLTTTSTIAAERSDHQSIAFRHNSSPVLELSLLC